MVSSSPERGLLLCCARSRLDSNTISRIKALLQEDIDWEDVLRTARSHGLMPLLYWHLNAFNPKDIPKTALDTLRDHFHANARRNLFLTGELLRLLKLFEANGTSAIPYKGPELAASAYGNLALREFRDLDILVRRRDVPRAKQLLIAQGYTPTLYLTDAQETTYLQSQYEYEFHRADGKVIVELHWGITPSYFAFPLNTDQLWERLKPVSLAGTMVPGLSPEDLLLMLCVHGTKHLWARLEWICCVAELIRTSETIDWEQLTEQAAAMGGARMLLLGLSLAHDLLGAALPTEVIRLVKDDPAVEDLKGLVREWLFLEANERPGIFGHSFFHIKARERLGDRIRYCFRLAFTTTARDWTAAGIPPMLSFLYYPIRAFRLANKYGPGLLRRDS